MRINSEQEMLDFGKTFAKNIITSTPPQATVIELVGDVGAGKTTFTRGLATGLQIKNPVTSPSFTISKAYALPSGGQLIHYDFYRLKDPGIMLEDLQEAITNPHNIIIIEWGQSVANILPPHHIKISLQKNTDGSREITITEDTTPRTTTKHQAKSPKLPPRQISIASRPNPAELTLYLDTSAPTTIIRINNQEYSHFFGNTLAEKLLGYLRDLLAARQADFHDLTAITFMSGPGSFTGLRIGATIVNTLASELNIPLYDHHGQKHPVIIPEYGRPANISKPQK